MTHRRFHRIRFTALGDLHHQGISYRVQLENLSQGGALVGSDECLMVLPGDDCVLSIQLAEGEEPLVASAQVVHSFFSMAGVRFLGFEKDGERRLIELLQASAGLPEPPAPEQGVSPPAAWKTPFPDSPAAFPACPEGA